MGGEASRQNGFLGGRPKGSIAPSTAKAMAMRAKLVEMVEKELDPIIRALLESAKGVIVAVTDPETGKVTNVFKKEPNVKAAQELLDRTFGKSTQPIDLGDGDALRTLVELVNATQGVAEPEEDKTPTKTIKTFHKPKKKPL